MKIYITAPFKGKDNKKDIEELCSVVRKSGFEDFCFVRDIERYQKIFSDPHELMQRSREEIEKCDALLINYDGPATGRMIEVGIAYTLGKKIILITKKGANIRDTIKGITDDIIEYEELEDIIGSLSKIIQ